MIVDSKNDIISLRRSQSFNIKTIKDTLQSVTLNPTELCNRRCSFCPRVDERVYPNRDLHISHDTIISIADKLFEYGFKGRFGWSGNGEPLLTSDIVNKIRMISKKNPQLSVHEINTNGDRLSKKYIDELYSAGLTHIIVSVYDGEDSLNKFKEMFAEVSSEKYTLRNSFNLNLSGFTNRGGMVSVNSDLNFGKNPCYFPFYKLVIDYNGDILICCDDWARKSKSELNINTHTLEEIWFSKTFSDYRENLRVGKRNNVESCKSCNVNGTKVGRENVEKFYEKTN